MSDTIIAKINFKDDSFFEPVHKTQVKRKSPEIKDTIAKYKKDPFFDTLDRIDNPISGTPKLTHYAYIADSENNKIDALEKSQVSRYSEADLEQDQKETFNQHRDLLNTTANLNGQVMLKLQEEQTSLHKDNDRFMKKLAEEAAKSAILGWFQIATAVSTLALLVLGVSAAVVTGGFFAGLGAAGAVSGALSGVVSGINGFHGLRTKETEGVVQVNHLKSEIGHNKITAVLADNQLALNQLHQHFQNMVTILRNRSQIKIF